MNNWIIWAVLALIAWGLWGLFPKLAVKHISPDSAIFYQVLGTSICGILLLFVKGEKPELSWSGGFFAGLAGIAAVLGSWFYLYAARESSISAVVIITSLYPIVTIFLACLVLGETMTYRKLFALILILTATMLLATEPTKAKIPHASKNSDFRD